MLFFLLTVLFPTGCWHGGLFATREKLLASVSKEYYNLLMWKYYERCALFVAPSKRAKFEGFALQYKDRLNITGYEIKQITYSRDKKEAFVSIAISYYLYPSVTERTVFLNERWMREGNTWFVADPQYEDVLKDGP
ncbi:MAG: hypothetical protein QXX77_10690 [Candidatus Methanosuratincola sp.]|jgi:hypothetical protein